MLKEFHLHCFPKDLGEACVYIRNHKGRVLDYERDGDWISVRYLCDKEL